ncbi:sugar ABC transporter substrate-binding protein [Vibrio salinus]|uniref:sugar ABC transporter substrate-binding protein n=1 Tax=Vibrio salinus TaxID=2899784 RepID=UPI001E331AF8|nr:sugar ABC transporter substrate-binding protein [Vibrio salinus]MCE0495004.1 sugar ABC transporter substrate-binding protein [Vibrio salinus]
MPNLKNNHKILNRFKSVKKSLVRGTVAAMGILALAGCGQDDKKADVTNIGVSIANFDDTFMISIKDAMVKYADEMGGKVKLTIVDSKEDTAKQLGQVENFLVQQMDAVIIVPVNTDATKPITDRVLKANTKLVYVNRKPDYLPDAAYYVGSNSIAFGEEQAKYVDKITKGGNIGILEGALTDEAAIFRTKGVEDYFADKPDYKVIRKQTGKWSRALGLSIVENWLSSGDEMNIIISNNDEMAIGASQALKAVNKLKDTVIVGVDATADGLAAIEQGNINATVFQDGVGQARGAIDAALDAIKGNKREQITWIPSELVTPENIKEFREKHKI